MVSLPQKQLQLNNSSTWSSKNSQTTPTQQTKDYPKNYISTLSRHGACGKKPVPLTMGFVCYSGFCIYSHGVEASDMPCFAWEKPGPNPLRFQNSSSFVGIFNARSIFGAPNCSWIISPLVQEHYLNDISLFDSTEIILSLWNPLLPDHSVLLKQIVPRNVHGFHLQE